MAIRAADLLGADAASQPANQSTRAEVARLMVDLAGVSEGMSVFDPVCGTGGLLLAAAAHVKRQEGEVQSLLLYGQELDPAKAEATSRALQAESLRSVVVASDTLRAPLKPNDLSVLLTFDVVLAHPPFSLADWGAEGWIRRDPLDRARFGLPPDGNGDYAFILHALASLKPHGRAVLLLPMGVLYRSGAEAKIREALICEGLIDAVISLPPGVNRGTKAPTVLLVLRRDCPPERRDKVLLVDGAAKASGSRSGQPSTPLDLSELAKLAQWEAKDDVHRRVVSIEEIIEQRFNLSLERFAPPGGTSNSTPAPMRPRRVKGASGEARPADLEAYEQAVQEASQRAGALFSSAGRGQPIHSAVAGEIPAHWTLEPLGELLKGARCDGFPLPKPNNRPPQTQPGELRSQRVGQSAFTLHGVLDVGKAKSLENDLFINDHDRLSRGDLLIKRVQGSVGRVGEVVLVLDDLSHPMSVGWAPGIVRVRPCQERLPSPLLWAWLRHLPIRQLLEKQALRSRQVSINQTILNELPCPVIRGSDELNHLMSEFYSMLHGLDEMWRCLNASSPPDKI